MAAAASISITGTITDLPGGDKTIGPVTVTSAAAVSSETQVTLASGDNTVTVPSTSTGVIVIFDSTSTTTKKFKGVGGDTGITVTKTKSCMLVWDTSAVPASFIINSSAADTGKTTTIIFF